VVHHLKDPEAGWTVLAGLLKPGGMMQLSLYSEAARRDLAAAQRIAQKNFPSDADGIRRFRRAAPRLLPRKVMKKLTMISDFYNLAETRDMLFHVMENRFTIPRIAAHVRKLDLEFVEFQTLEKTKHFYRQAFPGDKTETSLENWIKFEAKNPDVFIETYTFWCRRKG
jgi:hypothetical protein